MGILVSQFSDTNLGENSKNYKTYYEQILTICTLLVLVDYVLLVIAIYINLFFPVLVL